MKPGLKKIAAAAVILAVLAFFAIRHFKSAARPDPVYRGKSLTRWLKQLDDGKVEGISSGELPTFTPSQIEAAEAIRALGSDALPLLLSDIHAAPARDCLQFRFRDQLNSLIERVPGSRSWTLDWDLTEQDCVRWRAAQGLAALGPFARPAIPELKRLLFTNYFHSSIKEAAYALAAIGPEGIDILTNAVQPATEWSGMCAIWALGQHPAAGTNVIPFLISTTTSASEGTARGAIQVLGQFHTNGKLVIPALTNALASPSPAVRYDAARALGEFGPQAAAAAPLLQALTADPNVKNAALNALRKIKGAAPSF